MKQEILSDEIDKLPKTSRARLLKWWYPKYHRFLFCHPVFTGTGEHKCDSMNYISEMSIGQMIEYLNEFEPDKHTLKIYKNESYLKLENRISWETEDRGLVTTGTRSGWSIKFFFPNPWYRVDENIEHEELCDALWEIVKIALKQKQ